MLKNSSYGEATNLSSCSQPLLHDLKGATLPHPNLNPDDAPQDMPLPRAGPFVGRNLDPCCGLPRERGGR